jgi:polar amino acid transport system ATP-binding protein
VLTIKNLYKKFTSIQVLSGTEFELHSGEVGILSGASGTGKSTLLQCIAGSIPYDAGSITIDHVAMTPGRCHPNVNIVFQSFELFPHYDVISNVMLALTLVKKISKEEARNKARDLLCLMGIEGKANQCVSTLSGGQQQRLAIARACAMEPSLLLLDEPSSALDAKNTSTLVHILQQLTDRGMMVLIATHDLDFIKKLEDKITGPQQKVHHLTTAAISTGIFIA